MYFEYDPILNLYYYGEEPYTDKTFQTWKDSEHKLVGVDIEGISLKERIAIGISIASSPTCAFYWPLFPNESASVSWHMLKDPDIVNVYHNGIYDLGCLTEYGVKAQIEDTSYMARLLCHKSNALEDLAPLYRIDSPSTKQLLKEYKTKAMLDIPTHIVALHCCKHAMATFQLYHLFYPRTDLEYYNTEMATIPIMLTMSDRGIFIDQEMREELEENLTDDVDRYRESCGEMEDFNPGSTQQVGHVLAERGAYDIFGRLPYTRDKSGRPTSTLSTDAKVLGAMDDPLAALILLYRQKTKLLGTYILPWAGEERARTRYHLEAATGRPSSTDRNMQNIPGKYSKTGEENDYNCRGVLLPDNEIWTDLDFSQVEPRSLAYLSGDKEMQHIFSLPKFNEDGTKNVDACIHTQVANFMNVPRKVGKVINLAMTYGATDETLMETAGIKDRRRAADLRMMWGEKFPQAIDWIDSIQKQTLRTRIVESAFGRRMRIPDEESDARVKRCAVDYPCQSTAADVLKRGLIVLDKMGIDLALQVHDQYLMDGYTHYDKFHALRSVGPFDTPYDVSYCSRWE